jgi:hypothetical protein
MDGESQLPVSGGNAARVLRLTTLGSDGSLQVVEMPVIAIADAAGRVLTPLTDETLQAMLLELRAVRLGIQALLNAGQDVHDDLLELATTPFDVSNED